MQVTLDDATFEARAAYEGDPNDLVVHQQDIQAVANAMWNAGAVAVTIQGQRLISTTGIKCEGNQVTLHGLPYSPPYVIVGIGDPARLEAELTTDPILATYRDYTDDPRRRRLVGHDRAGLGGRPGVHRPARPHLRDADAGVSPYGSADPGPAGGRRGGRALRRQRSGSRWASRSGSRSGSPGERGSS